MTSRYDDDEQPRQKPAPAEEYDAEEADWEAGYAPAEEYDYEPSEEDAAAEADDAEEQVHVQPAAPVKPAATSKPAQPARPAVRPGQPVPPRNRAQGTARPAASRSAAPQPAQRSTRISRPVSATQPKQQVNYMIPLAVSGVLVIALIVVLFLFNNNGSADRTSRTTPGVVEGTVVPRGATVATVNDVPIYERDFQERADQDKANMMADPLSAALLNNFEGITGTRALEVVRYDALDKLINLEVIRQQAKAENLWPSDAQQLQLVDTAKQQDLTNGESFVDFLNAHSIGQEQYENAVLTRVVYAAMAQQHAPATGTADDKSNGFIAWICSARKNYTVNIIMHFTDVNNQACTSGPPLDIDLFGEAEPAPEATGAAPTVPAPIKAP